MYTIFDHFCPLSIGVNITWREFLDSQAWKPEGNNRFEKLISFIKYLTGTHQHSPHIMDDIAFGLCNSVQALAQAVYNLDHAIYRRNEGEEGNLKGKDCRIGLVVSKFNEFVTNRLTSAAVDTLKNQGVEEEHIDTVRVPGAFEIPLVARHLAGSKQYDAVICLGAVIRGETPHFDYISAEMSRGIAQASWETGIPIVFGVLTTNTAEQALERSGESEKNRGVDAARTAIEMATLMKSLHSSERNPTGFL